jgi:hypothetical protein
MNEAHRKDRRCSVLSYGGVIILPANAGSLSSAKDEKARMISALIGTLSIIVFGAICFWAIDRFGTNRRLARLLKLLVVLVCLAAIVQRVLPQAGLEP